MSIIRNQYWRSKKGLRFEKLALEHLQAQGLDLVGQNYRCRMGEIDIIMRENDSLIFVEVRYRANADYGGAMATITASKQRKLRLTAQHFLLCHHQHQSLNCRFDVIGISANIEGSPKIAWIKNAFY